MQPTDGSVDAFIDAVPNEVRRRDARTLVELMEHVTGEQPRMWGTIIGFGHTRYEYASGRSGESGIAGFAPRKASTTVYLADGTANYASQLAKLGPHTTGLVCLYLKDLSKVDLGVLEEIITESADRVKSGEFVSARREG